MARTERHPIWTLFLMIASEGGITEAQGIQKIKDLFPTTYAKDVDAVIAASGNMAQLDSGISERHAERMREESTALESRGLNATFRESRGATKRLFTDDDDAINKALRERRGRLMAAGGSER